MSYFTYFQENQPISFTGFFRHIALWLNSSRIDDVYFLNSSPTITPKKRVAIYCIHGTADRVSSFSLIAERLKARNKLPPEVEVINVVAFDHRAEGKGIEFYADQLKEKIALKKDQDVIFIGHSRGALIASYYTEMLAKEAGVNVHAVISICGPFDGSTAALPLTWLSTSLNEMVPGSFFLKNLRQKIASTQTKYLCISAEKDSLVSRSSAELNEGAGFSSYSLSRHGHLSVMSSHRLVETIEDYLDANLQLKQPMCWQEPEVPILFSEELTTIPRALKALKKKEPLPFPWQYLNELEEQIHSFSKLERGDQNAHEDFVQSLWNLHEDLKNSFQKKIDKQLSNKKIAASSAVNICKETTKLLVRLQWNSKPYHLDAIKNYEKACRKTGFINFFKAVAAVVVSGVTCIVGSKEINLAVGAKVIGISRENVKNYLFFQPKKHSQHALQTCKKAREMGNYSL